MIDKAVAAKHVADGVAGGVAALAIMQWIPPAAGLLTIVWMTVQIVSSDLFRDLLFKLTGFDIAKWRKIDEPPA